MRFSISLPFALLGLQLASARVADLRGSFSTSLSTRWTQDELMGEQQCPKCNKKGMTNFCDGSTFEKGDKKQWNAGGEAANIKDCTSLMAYLNGTNQKALFLFPLGKVDASKYNAVKASEPGNCAIAFKAKEGDTQGGSAALAMGSGDVFEIIRDSIAKFGENGKVLAHGESFCRGNGADKRWGDRWVDWKIFNPYG